MLILFLVSLASVVLGDWPLQDGPFELTGSTAHPLDSILHVNLKRSTQIRITHSRAVQICLQEGYPAPVDTKWWNQSCTRYWPISSDGSPKQSSLEDAQLRNVPYNMAVALWDEDGSGIADKTGTVSFSFGSAGDSCEGEDEIFDGIICRQPDLAVLPNVTFQITIPQNQTNTTFYSFVVPEGIQEVIVSADETLIDATFQIRRAATPYQTDGLHDGTKGSTSRFAYPRPGNYFLAVSPVSSSSYGNLTILITLQGCNSSANVLGPGCQDKFNTTNKPDMQMVAYKKEWRYWRVIATSQSPVFVSVRSYDGTYFPQIFASKGQLPRIGNNDLANCHGSSCNGANVMNITATSDPEYWYIGVTAGEGANDTTYGIWFNSVCAPNCEVGGNGVCIYSGPNIGECQCASQYMGADCSVQSQDMARFVVLCVIAGLLVVSSVVGLIVQKVQNYRANRGQGNYEAL